MCPEGAQVFLLRERCVPKVLKLSCKVSESKPLMSGLANVSVCVVSAAGPYGAQGARLVVGQCRLTVSKPEFKAPVGSALTET
jgi:hypothetical protein